MTELNEAYTHARNLLLAIAEKHYPDRSPKFAPLDDLIGVLTQIDNLTAGMARAPLAAAPVEPVAALIEEILTARQTRAEALHDMLLEARELVRVKLKPETPPEERAVFDKLQAALYTLRGDPFDMHIRSALTPPAAPTAIDAAEGSLLDQAVAFAEMWGTEQNWPHVRDAYVAAILRERTTPPAAPTAIDVAEVEFLLDRLDEFERDINDAEDWAGYFGHVRPAAARTRAALASLKAMRETA